MIFVANYESHCTVYVSIQSIYALQKQYPTMLQCKVFLTNILLDLLLGICRSNTSWKCDNCDKSCILCDIQAVYS